MARKSEGEKWGDRLTAARNARKPQEAEWRANRGALLGKSYGVQRGRQGDAVNLAWAAFQTVVGQVYSRNPDPIIRETNPLLALAARTLTQMTIEDFEQGQVRYPARLAMCDVFWAGFGVVGEKLETDITSQSFKFSDGSEGSANVPESQRYNWFRVHPETILFDPNGMMPNLSDHKWISVQFFPTVKELRDDDTFSISAKTLKGLPRLRSSPAMRNSATGYFSRVDAVDDPDDEFAQVACEEVWDRVNRKKYYIPCGTDEIIGTEDWPVELRYNGTLLFPFSVLYWNENPDEFWPIPDISTIRPQLQQYNHFFKWVLADATSKWRRFVTRGDIFDRGQLDKLTAGGDTEVVTYNGKIIASETNFDIARNFLPVADPVVKGDQVSVLNMVKQTVHEILGAGDFASAGFRSTRSATEAAALSDFLRSRMTNKTENVDAFFHQMTVIHALMLQETLTKPRTVQVESDDGIAVWRDITKDDIQGRFKFQIVAGSSMPQNTETKRQEAIAFFQQVIPIVVQSGGDPRPIIEWMAPLQHMPQSVLDRTWKNQRNLWMQVALEIKKAYMGGQSDPAAFTDLVSAAVMASLSPSEIAQVDKAAQQQGTPAGQPVSPAGTNTTNQRMPT
jgi:hypothetical protein